VSRNTVEVCVVGVLASELFAGLPPLPPHAEITKAPRVLRAAGRGALIFRKRIKFTRVSIID
jgi:hypothetical protein